MPWLKSTFVELKMALMLSCMKKLFLGTIAAVAISLTVSAVENPPTQTQSLAAEIRSSASTTPAFMLAVEPFGKSWVRLREAAVFSTHQVVVSDISIPTRTSEWLAKAPQDFANQIRPVIKSEDTFAIPIRQNRWVIASFSETLVRMDAITAIDPRRGAIAVSPPMPGPGSGGKGSLIATPIAEGFTITAGVARVFVGARTGTNGLDPASAPTTEDLKSLALIMALPSPEVFADLLDGVVLQTGTPKPSTNGSLSIKAIETRSSWLNLRNLTVTNIFQAATAIHENVIPMEDWIKLVPRDILKQIHPIDDAMAIPFGADKWAIGVTSHMLVRKSKISGIDPKGWGMIIPSVAIPPSFGFNVITETGRFFVGIKSAITVGSDNASAICADLRSISAKMDLPNIEDFASSIGSIERR